MNALPILILLTAAAGADDLIPQAFPKDRYNDTIGKSPFVLETKVAEPTTPVVNPFQNLYVSLVSKDDGKDYVLIKRIGEERALKAFVGSEPGDDGYMVKSVRNGSTVRETKVVLQKGSDIGEIGFKEDSNTPPPIPNAGRGPGFPGGMPKPGGPMPMPQMPGVQPRPPQITPVQQPVPRPGGGTSSAQFPVQKPITIPQTPGGGGGSVRTRPRTINN